MMSATATALSRVEDRLFTEARIRWIATALLASNLVILLWALLAGRSVMTGDGAPSAVDFLQFYVIGTFAGSAHPALAYDYGAFSAAQAAIAGSVPGGLPYYHFIYPPILMLFTAGLPLVPFFASFAVWVGGSLALYAAAIYAIVPRGIAIVAALAPLSVLKNAQLGQNGFLTAALFGFALATLERHPLAAGVFIGLLTYKPQFGVLVPLALIAGGQWRALAGAIATTLVLGLATGIVFGLDVWTGYLSTLGGFDARLSPDPRMEVALQSVFGWFSGYGPGPGLAWMAQLAVAALVAILVCVVWSRSPSFSLKAAALCLGAVAATPYVLTYDLILFNIAVAFLVQDGFRNGFCPGDRILLLSWFAGTFLLAMPIGPVLCALLLVIVVRRAVAAPQVMLGAGARAGCERRAAVPGARPAA